jgi:glutamine synthetase type III
MNVSSVFERIKHSKKFFWGWIYSEAWETEAGRELSNFKTTPQALSESIKTSQIYSQKWGHEPYRS